MEAKVEAAARTYEAGPYTVFMIFADGPSLWYLVAFTAFTGFEV